MATRSKRLTHTQRLDIINAPLPVIQNFRTVYPVKRWAGVFVDDYFGEAAGRKKALLDRLPGMTNNEPYYSLNAQDGIITKFDESFHIADYVLWERIATDDEN